MNATIELLKARRSAPPPTLAGPGPTEAEIATMLSIASRVPDHGKLAPWRFILFEGEGRERAARIVGEAFRQAHPEADEAKAAGEAKRLLHAPFIVAVVSRAAPHPKIPVWEQELSAGAVCMSLVIAANALGYATAWLTEWYAYDRAVLDRLGVAPNEKIAGFVHIGRNDAAREDRSRPALAELTTKF